MRSFIHTLYGWLVWLWIVLPRDARAHSAVLLSRVVCPPVCPSLCKVEVSWSYRLGCKDIQHNVFALCSSDNGDLVEAEHPQILGGIEMWYGKVAVQS